MDAQMADMSKQMEALDDFVAKARSHNGRSHEAHLSSLDAIASNVRKSRSVITEQLDGFDGRAGQLQEDVDMRTEELQQSTAPLEGEVRQPLIELRANVQGHPLREYVPTGVTPQKRKYEYPTDLPRTESHDGLRSRHRTSKQFTALPFNEEPPPLPSSPAASPPKTFIFSDAAEEVGTHSAPSSATNSSNTGLREVDVNVARPLAGDADDSSLLSSKPETPAAEPTVDLADTPEKEESEQPPLKRRRSQSSHPESKLPQKMLSKKMAGMMEGRENVPPHGRRFYSNRTQN